MLKVVSHYYLQNSSKIGFFVQPFGGHVDQIQNGRQSGAFTWVDAGYDSMGDTLLVRMPVSQKAH